MEAKRAKLFPGSQPMDIELSNMVKVNAEKILCLFNTAYFIVKGNMAFLKFPDLMRLQRKNGLSILDNYINDKSCRMFVRWIAEELKREFRRDIDASRFLSVLADGSRDSGNIENELICMRYVKDGEAITKYAAIEAVKKSECLRNITGY